MHAVYSYFHIFFCKERVHCSLGGEGGRRTNYNVAAMLLKVLQIQVESSVGGKGNLMFLFFVLCLYIHVGHTLVGLCHE